jgi:hypothetical protein
MNMSQDNYQHPRSPNDFIDVEVTMSQQIDTPKENVWPNQTCSKIDESFYSFCVLAKVLCRSISGIVFIILSAILLVRFLFRSGVHAVACIFMNLCCFGIVLLVIHLIKRKITGTPNDVSITLLLRYYNFGVICMFMLMLAMSVCNPRVPENANPHLFNMKLPAQTLFYGCIVIVMVLSIIMALYRGTLRERCMRFFFMWPLKDEKNDSKNPDKLLHILWITRQLIQAVVIGYAIVATDLFIAKFKYGNEHLYLEYNAIKSFFRAAFLEEYFKFFIAGSVPFITKYNQSKSAILHVSIMVGLSFALVEDISYCSIYGFDAIMRIPMFPLHFVFAYPAAVAITRQRNSILWVFEVIGSFLIGVAAHGIFNYLLFISEDNPNFGWCHYVSCYGLGALFTGTGFYILYKNPFLPGDEELEKNKDVRHTAQNDYTQQDSRYV